MLGGIAGTGRSALSDKPTDKNRDQPRRRYMYRAKIYPDVMETRRVSQFDKRTKDQRREGQPREKRQIDPNPDGQDRPVAPQDTEQAGAQGQRCGIEGQRLHDPPVGFERCHFVPPNGWRLSGDGGEADGVRCSRGLGNRPRLDTTYSWGYALTC